MRQNSASVIVLIASSSARFSLLLSSAGTGPNPFSAHHQQGRLRRHVVERLTAEARDERPRVLAPERTQFFQ
jgi:hypothetical protein